MLNRWTLNSGVGKRFLIATPSGIRAPERSRVMPPREAGHRSRDLLHRCSRDDLCDMYTECTMGYVDLTRMSNDQLIRAVGRDIESGRLLVIPLPREEWVGLAPSALPSEPLPAPAPPIAPAKEKVELLVSIDREPPVASSANARFILSASDGSYRAEKGVGDDRVPGNDSIDLLFEELDPDKSYTLEVLDPSHPKPIRLFEAVPYAQLSGLTPQSEEVTDEPEEATEEDEGVEAVLSNWVIQDPDQGERV